MTIHQEHDPSPEPMTMTTSCGSITSVPVRVKKPIALTMPDGKELECYYWEWTHTYPGDFVKV